MTRHLRTELWVAAYLRVLDRNCRSAYITARGDPDHGTVLVKITDRNGQARLMQRGFDLARDQSRWLCVAEGKETDLGPSLARQKSRDADLWILEVDSPDGAHFLTDD